MQVQVADNISRHMVSILAPAIEQSDDIRIAVAFVSCNGLVAIDAPMKIALQREAYVEFLVGLDTRATEPEALKRLYQLTIANSNVALYCYASLKPSAIYHPKMYLLKSGEKAIVIIGSSNLTQGGLEKNVEANVVIQAAIQEEVISDIYATYNQLKFHPQRVAPDEEFLMLYAQLCQTTRKRERKSVQDATSRALADAFVRKTESLRRPAPTRRDLVGWLELVYDVLPEGEFTNQWVYRYEQEFQQHYPQNLNIRAKIRQQLQVLRDMGLIKHIRPGYWQKG